MHCKIVTTSSRRDITGKQGELDKSSKGGKGPSQMCTPRAYVRGLGLKAASVGC